MASAGSFTCRKPLRQPRVKTRQDPPATRRARNPRAPTPTGQTLIAENRAVSPTIYPNAGSYCAGADHNHIASGASTDETPQRPSVPTPSLTSITTLQSSAAAAPITPPRAIRSYPPVLTEALSRGITGEVRVSVKVNLDESGRITGVESVQGNRPVPPGLARLAAAAVRRWEFEPARRGAERIPGDIVLSFIFRK